MKVEALHKKAKKFARGRGYPQDADDFAQEFIMDCIRIGREASLEWGLINYLRRTYGDSRTRGGRLRLNTLSLDAPLTNDMDSSLYDIVAAPDVPVRAVVPFLPRNERDILVLERVLDGYLQREVGEEFGFCEGRAGQIIRSGRRRYDALQLGLMFAPPHTRGWVQQVYRGVTWIRRSHLRAKKKK